MAPARRHPLDWPLRGVPRPARVLLVGVELLAVALTVLAVLGTPVDALVGTWGTAVALAVAAVVHTECSLSIERARSRLEATPHADLTTVWTFAGALLLPAPSGVALVVAVYLHLYLRAWRRIGVPPYRVVFSTATVLLSVLATAAVVTWATGAPDVLVLPLGLLVYAVVNLALVIVAIRMSSPGTRLADAVGHRDELLMEFATLAMGAVVAAVIGAAGPAYVLLALPPLVVLHRTVLVRQLATAAVTDVKTGLLTAAEWSRRASIAVRRARNDGCPAAVLLLDLDHFKAVNDRYGHLAGDAVLAAVAAELRSEVRDDDLVGRFGGEEFVVLLAGAPGEDLDVGALVAAERIRGRVAALRPDIGPDGPARVTLSVGVATVPRDGTDVDRLLEVADASMYAAKAAGRDTVCGRLSGTEPDRRPLRAREA